jgi:hypothetical protein
MLLEDGYTLRVLSDTKSVWCQKLDNYEKPKIESTYNNEILN